MTDSSTAEPTVDSAIAIVAMAGRFPKAADIETFWTNLRDGVEAISRFDEQELLAAGIDPAIIKHPQFVGAGGVLDAIDEFDAAFFGFNPREAETLDPQHRLFLETASEALERAGYDPTTYAGSIGLYGGVSPNTYLMNNVLTNPGLLEVISPFQIKINNDKDFLTTLVSYKLDLRGPSVAVQTACSTSLVATCMACQSLLTYQCDIALAGGVSVKVPHKAGYVYQPGGILSPDGHCRAFDVDAGGSIDGNGAGVVVLKRLADALEDGDQILAVIKGSAINNDGALKVNYTAPSVDGQAEVISMAQAVAGVSADTISYVETHGAGTLLGDPIEIAALTQAFRASTDRTGFCAIGSVKTNIGHLDTAAGVSGLIKTVLALKHGQIPPSLHYTQPNAQIDFASSPFYVNTQLATWPRADGPRRAGVSSFGVGGTNAHLVLEEAPQLEPSDAPQPWQLIPLSAKTPTALDTMTERLAQYLEQQPDANFADIAYTLQIGRRTFNHRQMLVVRDRADALAVLRGDDPLRVLRSVQETRDRQVAFVFAGLGDHYPEMGLELYQREAVFRETVDQCAELLEPLLDLDIRDVLYPRGTDAAVKRDGTQVAATQRPAFDLRQLLNRTGSTPQPDASADQLNQTALAQPAVFVVEYALAQLWQSWGVVPHVVLGYSLGEYVAACVAGVLTLEDALLLVAKRAQMIQRLPGGAMLSVYLPAEELQPLLGPRLSLSAINAPSVCVVAGPPDAVAELETRLASQDVAVRRLATTHAFHSQMMEPIAGQYARLVETVTLNPPQIPYLSNVTGTWISASEATDPHYWVRHMRQPVRFADVIGELWRAASYVLLEIGPGQGLGGIAVQHPDAPRGQERLTIQSLGSPHDRQADRAVLLGALGRLWLHGAAIDWDAVHLDERRRRLSLPTYPFERQRYWIAPGKRLADGQLRQSRERRPDLSDWFSVPAWKQSFVQAHAQRGTDDAAQAWLVFADSDGLGDKIAARLIERGASVVTVHAAERFSQLDAHSYALDPGTADDYRELVTALANAGRLPTRVLHLWSLALDPTASGTSLISLAHALGARAQSEPVQLWAVADGLHQIESSDRVDPDRAALLGVCAAIPTIYPHLLCRSVDLGLTDNVRRRTRAAELLLGECLAAHPEATVAYRGQQRWVRTFEALRLEQPDQAALQLVAGQTYLIVGGDEAQRVTLAEQLAQIVPATLVLVGETDLPARVEWDAWLSAGDASGAAGALLQRLRDLEQRGASIELLNVATVASKTWQRAAAEITRQLGPIDGVIVTTAGTADDPAVWSQIEASAAGVRVLVEQLQSQPRFWLLTLPITPSAAGADHIVESALSTWAAAFAAEQIEAGQTPWLRLSADLQSLTVSEGATLLERTLAIANESPLLATPLPLPAEFDRVVERTATSEQVSNVPDATHLRPDVRTAYVAPSTTIQRTIATIWQRVLGIEQIGVYDDFFELGGHSLLAPQLLAQLRETYGIDLPLSILFELPTVAGLAQIIDLAQREGADVAFASTAVDLAAEVVLDPTITAAGLAPATLDEPRAILLTGATGFLGAFLLADLLRETQATVYCLARAADDEQALARLQRSLQSYALWDARYVDRIRPVAGDLAQPQWGLSDAQFAALAETIEVIYHCGAWVNFIYPYSALKPTNVLGLQETLRLASTARLKPVHYVSSVAVFSPLGYAAEQVIPEDRALEYSSGFFSGYAETKWVAEQLIGLARERGIPVSIYRPGVIGGHSETGIGNTKDLVWSIMKGCIQLGIVPDIDSVPDIDTVVDVTPVDYVSRAIVHLSRQPERLGQVFHFPNPQPMHWQQVAEVIRSFGYQLRQVSNAEWQAALTEIVGRTPDNALHPFLPLLIDMHPGDETPQHAHATDLRFDDRLAQAGLADSGIVCAPVDAQLLRSYFDYFIRIGFVESPASR